MRAFRPSCPCTSTDVHVSGTRSGVLMIPAGRTVICAVGAGGGTAFWRKVCSGLEDEEGTLRS